MTGDSGEDAIKLVCTVIVEEGVMFSSYQFTWSKDATPIDISNDRIVVRTHVCMYKIPIQLFPTASYVHVVIYVIQLYRSPTTIAHHH